MRCKAVSWSLIIDISLGSFSSGVSPRRRRRTIASFTSSSVTLIPRRFAICTWSLRSIIQLAPTVPLTGLRLHVDDFLLQLAEGDELGVDHGDDPIKIGRASCRERV